MLAILITLLLLCNLTLYGFYFFSKAIIKNYLFDYLKTTQGELAKSAELLVNQINMSSIRLLINSDIYNLLNDKEISYNQKSQQLKKILDEMTLNTKIIKNITIITEKNELYQYSAEKIYIEKPDSDFIKQIRTGNSSLVFGPIMRDSKKNAYISLGKKYHNFYTGQNLGCLIVNVSENALYDMYKNISPNLGYSFILSDGNHVISHPDKTVVGDTILDHGIFNLNQDIIIKTGVFNEQSCIISISKLKFNWRIVSIISEKKLYSIIESLNKYIWIIEIIICIISAFLSVIISSRIAKPLSVLTGKLKRFGVNSNLKLDFIKNNKDELWELEKCYNDMIVRIRELIEKNNEEKEKQRDLELVALQAQINPHFLYNTLDSISCIAKLKKQYDIDKLVMALSKFFRISLHKGDKFITIQEEIEHVKNFVTIEQIRFPDQFDITYNIQESILDCSILKIILQPIVENSIKHGISLKMGFGHIWINGYRDGGNIKFEVIDDGVGFDKNSNLQADPLSNSGYGLRNVDERIKLEYGQQYGINIESTKDIGTKVEISLKIR